jgi:hypothetical protein
MAIGAGMGGAMAGAYAQQPQFGGAPPNAPPQPNFAPPPAATAGHEVTCSACHAKQPGGKFCAECGAPLAQAKKFCTGCGGELMQTAKFCANCGTPAGAPPAAT